MEDCREKVLTAAPAIVDALIAKAAEGSYQHAKFLFDFANTAPVRQKDDEDDIPGPSLAEILIERLKIIEAEDAAAALADGVASA